jgi:alpha-1,2-glucosyltransferase
VLYAYAATQLMHLKYRRAPPGGKEPAKLHDPPAAEAGPEDLVKAAESLPAVLPDLLPPLVPYALVLAGFGVFVYWNGGIVLGAKSSRIRYTQLMR